MSRPLDNSHRRTSPSFDVRADDARTRAHAYLLDAPSSPARMPASACDLAAAGDLDALRQLPRSALLLPDKNGHTAAHWAAGSGQLPTLEWLIAAGLEADGVGRVSTRSKRRRPLHFAARNGQLDVVQHLCEVAGADPDLVRVS